MDVSQPSTVTSAGGGEGRSFIRPVPKVPDHELLSCIGSGSYGEVWLARNIMGTYRAVKVVYRASFDSDRPFEREFSGINLYEPVSRTQENLVDILQVGRNDAEGYFYSVMELCDDINLGQNIDPSRYTPRTLGKELTRRGRLTVDESIEFTLALASGLGHLHRNKLIHRDIKPSNIIFVNGIPKIADIGLVTSEGCVSLAGTEGFIPPEGPGTPQADIFSLGKVLYEASTGKDRLQFPALPDPFESNSEYSQLLELNEVILRACEQDTRRRYASTDELLADLRLLQTGRSVRRLRTLEHRLRLVVRGGLIAAALAVLVSAGLYQTYRERTISNQSLGKSLITQGAQWLDRRDFFEALPCFAAALSVDDNQATEAGRRIHWQITLRECPRLLRLWSVHARISDAHFSPDGRWVLLASASTNPNLRVNAHDVEGRFHSRTYPVPGSHTEAESARFSPDGTLVLAAASDGTAYLWEAATTQLLATNALRTNGLLGASFSPDGRRIALACLNGEVRLHGLDFQPAISRRIHQAASPRRNDEYDDANRAEFSPDGLWLATAGKDNRAHILDSITLEPAPLKINELQFNSWAFQAVFSPDGRFLAFPSYANVVRILELATGQTYDIEPDAPVRAASFSPDGRYLAAALWDHTCAVRIWDLRSRTRQEAFTPIKHATYPGSVAFSPDGHRLLTTTADGYAWLWELAVIEDVPETEPPVFDPRGTYVATRDASHVLLTRPSTPEAPPDSLNFGQPVDQIIPARDGRHLLLITRAANSPTNPTCYAQLWSVSPPTNRSALLSYPTSITNALVNRDATRLFTWSNTLGTVFDTLTGLPIGPSFNLSNEVTHAAFSPAGDRIVTSHGATWTLRDASTGSVHQFGDDRLSIGDLEFSPDGRAFAVSHDEGQLQGREVHVRDATTGQLAAPPLPHRDGVKRARFSHDGSWLVTCGEDRTALVWKWATGKHAPPFVHKHQVTDATFSPDDRWIATTDRNNEVRVWDASSGMPVSPSWKIGFDVKNDPTRETTLQVEGIRFLDGGRQVAAWGTHDPVPEAGILPVAWSHPRWQTWELAADQRPIEDVLSMTRLLSGHREPDGSASPMTDGADRDFELLWKRLAASYPSDFTVSPHNIAHWYRRHARLAEEAGDWFAVRFNLERLRHLEPNNLQLADYLRQIPTASH